MIQILCSFVIVFVVVSRIVRECRTYGFVEAAWDGGHMRRTLFGASVANLFAVLIVRCPLTQSRVTVAEMYVKVMVYVQCPWCPH